MANDTSSVAAESKLRVSRRNFLKTAGVGAGAAAVAGGLGVIPFSESRAAAQQSWDQEADVVVVGSGAAAYTMAITAAHEGSSVIMLEKASSHGGTTIKSGGGHWQPNHPFLETEGLEDPREDAIKYMARYSYPQLYNPDDPQLGLPANEYELITTFYDKSRETVEFTEGIGAQRSVIQRVFDGGLAPDYMDHFPENKLPRGRLIQPLDDNDNPAGGAEMIRQFAAKAEELDIPLLLNHRVVRLVLNDADEVIGVEALVTDEESTGTPEAGAFDGQIVAIRARKGVGFGTGGFTHDKEMMLQYQRGPQFGGCAVPTNEGDFVRIAGAVGARLGNMQNAYRAQIVLEQALDFASVATDVFFINGDSTILVNKFGQRVVDEKRNYNDRAEVHFNWDPNMGDWPNQFLFQVYDERVAQGWSGNYPIPAAGRETPYVIKGETLEELAVNLAARVEELAPYIGNFRVDESFAANLEATIARYNEFAAAGKDEDFQRGEFDYDNGWHNLPSDPDMEYPSPDQPSKTMYPISDSGPYYAIILAAGTLDTNGGPVTNKDAQVLNTDNEPIPGLYGAGNCVASPTANAYWGGGATLGSAMVYGYIAGKNLHNEAEKSA